MMEGSIVVIVFLLLVLITLLKGIRLVPQGSKWVVQRLGKFHTTLNPGLNIIVPYIDSVSYKVTTKDIVLDIPSQEVITLDNVVILANAVAYINIVSPEKAVYGVEDYELAIRTLVQTSLRSIVGEMKLDDALKTVEIQDINPSGTMQEAMEEQAAAERQRRATVTRADGEKTAAILNADGRLEASRRDAEAQVVLAEATKTALTKVSDAIQDKELPAMYLLGEKYVDALTEMGGSDNAKLVVLPGDLPAAVRSIMNNTK